MAAGIPWEFPMTPTEQRVNLWALFNEERRLHERIADDTERTGANPAVVAYHRERAKVAEAKATEALREAVTA